LFEQRVRMASINGLNSLLSTLVTSFQYLFYIHRYNN